LRPNESYLDDQRRIAAVIEEAFALAATDTDVEPEPLGLLIARQYDAAGRWVQRHL
jgi:hypothetical protein